MEPTFYIFDLHVRMFPMVVMVTGMMMMGGSVRRAGEHQ
jgi:hypothetical protein